jgi:hypothetical protein
MKSSDLKKGDKVVLVGTNWKATILDNQKSRNIRLAEVQGLFTECGSIYVWDIQGIELTPKQQEAKQLCQSMGF